MISTLDIGTPSRDAMICAKVVAWPWPWLCVPSSACTLPSCCTRICAASKKPTRAPSAAAIRDGATPEDST